MPTRCRLAPAKATRQAYQYSGHGAPRPHRRAGRAATARRSPATSSGHHRTVTRTWRAWIGSRRPANAPISAATPTSSIGGPCPRPRRRPGNPYGREGTVESMAYDELRYEVAGPVATHHHQPSGAAQRPHVGRYRRLRAALARRPGRIPRCGCVVLTGAGDGPSAPAPTWRAWRRQGWTDRTRTGASWPACSASCGTWASPPSPGSGATPWPAASAWRWPATWWWRPTTPCSARPRSTSACGPSSSPFRSCRSMPPKPALELMMTGRRVDAEEGARLGFVNRVVPAAELDTATSELVGVLAAKSPVAMRMGLNAFYRVVGPARRHRPGDAPQHAHGRWPRRTTRPRAWRRSARSARRRGPDVDTYSAQVAAPRTEPVSGLKSTWYRVQPMTRSPSSQASSSGWRTAMSSTDCA